MTRTDLTVRPGLPEDLQAVARVHLRARAAAGAWMPPPAHSPAEVVEHFEAIDLDAGDRVLWVAESEGEIVGYTLATPAWLEDLYVVPDHQRSGVGSALFELVTSSRPHGFCLWVFESNEPALAFYARHGCLVLERTDGSANEEHAPDVRVVWPGQDPLACLRALIDEVDDLLADVLLRRTALTRAVQAVKGTTQRDPRREAQIVERLAVAVPDLGEERVARIVDVIIRESVEGLRS